MTPPKKQKENRTLYFIKIFLITTAAIGVLISVVMGIMKYGEDKKETETRLFTSNEMRVKTEEWVNSPHNEVELYKIQEKSIQAKKDFDTAFVVVKNILTDDIENKKDRIRSRAVRDSLFLIGVQNDSITADEISDMKDQLKIQNLSNELILKELKEIKENQGQ